MLVFSRLYVSCAPADGASISARGRQYKQTAAGPFMLSSLIERQGRPFRLRIFGAIEAGIQRHIKSTRFLRVLGGINLLTIEMMRFGGGHDVGSERGIRMLGLSVCSVRAVSLLKSYWLHPGESGVTGVSISYAGPNVRKGSNLAARFRCRERP